MKGGTTANGDAAIVKNREENFDGETNKRRKITPNRENFDAAINKRGGETLKSEKF